MGSEVSSNTNNFFEMELATSDRMPQAEDNTKRERDIPTRSTLYAEDFYCPLLMVNDNANRKVTPSFEQEQFINVENQPVIFKETRERENFLDKETKSKHYYYDAKETETQLAGESRCGLDYLLHSSEIHADKIKKENDTAVVKSELKQIKENCGHPDPILGPILSNRIELKDLCTNTSQPTCIETAAGNSQPYLMIDCATGMSQPSGVGTADCWTQTSQEVPYFDQPILEKNETTILHHQNYQSTLNKPLIVFPRVSCQTTAPEIPAKIPRLNDLDREIIMNPIYSSEVTFDFDEADKENNSSILRQRGNVGKRMNDASSMCTKYNSHKSKPSSENENLSGDKLTPLSASSCSNVLIASRGPFLRVGLSKKLRTRNPLHPKNISS